MVLIMPVPSARVCAPWLLASSEAGMLTQPDSRNATQGEVAFHRATCGSFSLCEVGEKHMKILDRACFENRFQNFLCQLQKCPVVTSSFSS